jgi:hypothetical protein
MEAYMTDVILVCENIYPLARSFCHDAASGFHLRTTPGTRRSTFFAS